MFIVYRESGGGVRVDIEEFEREIDAVDFCDRHDWEWIDENRFQWNLDYREV